MDIHQTHYFGLERVTHQEVKMQESGASQTGQISMKEGQIVQGEVIDLRYNSISIQLENGQVVTAKLECGIPLSIGQTAQFQITGDAAEKIILKYLPESIQTMTDTTVIKALTASGLPQTDRNKTLVMELLNQGMSINKHFLQAMVKLCCKNREVSPLTLVLMEKYRIPITKDNMAQLESYLNGTHQLLGQLRGISHNFVNMLQSCKLPVPDQQPALEAGTSTVNSPSTQSGMAPMADLLWQEADCDYPANLQPGTMNPSPLPPFYAGSPNALMEQPYFKWEDVLQDNRAFLDILTVDTSLQEYSENADSKSNHTVMLQTILSPEERKVFFTMMQNFPGIEHLGTRILDGTATLHDILNFLKETLPGQNIADAGTLLQSGEYGKILKEAFHQRWTITPEKLAQKDSLRKLYQNIENDLQHLDDLTKAAAASEKVQELQEPVKNLQNNLNFMKELNEAFTYLQLPIQFKNQDIHSDLYVYTKKNTNRNQDDDLHVHLHLDMTHLGPVNIQLHMKHHQIDAKFYLENPSIAQLLSENISQLTDQLQRKGYHLDSQILDSHKKPDMTDLFMKQNMQMNNISRYSFDIRT